MLFTKKADIFVSDEQHLQRNEQGALSVRVGGLLHRKWKDKMVAVRGDELCVWEGFDAFSAGKVSVTYKSLLRHRKPRRRAYVPLSRMLANPRLSIRSRRARSR